MRNNCTGSSSQFKHMQPRYPHLLIRKISWRNGFGAIGTGYRRVCLPITSLFWYLMFLCADHLGCEGNKRRCHSNWSLASLPGRKVAWNELSTWLRDNMQLYKKAVALKMNIMTISAPGLSPMWPHFTLLGHLMQTKRFWWKTTPTPSLLLV